MVHTWSVAWTIVVGAQALALLDSLIAASNELVDIISKVGVGVTTIAVVFVALIKWLGKRKPNRIETKGGETQIHIGITFLLRTRRR